MSLNVPHIGNYSNCRANTDKMAEKCLSNAQNIPIINARRDVGAAEFCSNAFDTLALIKSCGSLVYNTVTYYSDTILYDTIFGAIGYCDSIYVQNIEVNWNFGVPHQQKQDNTMLRTAQHPINHSS